MNIALTIPKLFRRAAIVVLSIVFVALVPASGSYAQAGGISEKTYRKFAAAQELMEAENHQGALKLLDDVKAKRNLTPTEAIQLYSFYGVLYLTIQDYEQSIKSFETVLAQPQLQERQRTETLYTLAQLRFTIEDWQAAIDIMEEWLKVVEDPSPQPHIMLASALYKLEKFREMIPAIETAMDIARERDIPIREQWWLLAWRAHWELEDFTKVREVYEILMANWPKEEYAFQLAAGYASFRAEKKAVNALRDLLETWPDTDYAHPLDLAAAVGDLTQVMELIDKGADVNAKNPGGFTAIKWAVVQNQAAIVDQLIAAGADMGSALMEATALGQTEIVDMLINKDVDVNARAKGENTALHFAVMESHREVVELLIAAGADIDASNKSGRTPLHLAAFLSGDASIVEMLVTAGADVNAKSDDEKTALHFAAHKGEPVIIELLIAAGADVNVRDDGGSSPLMVAAITARTSVVRLLIEAGADVDAKNYKNKWAALHLAIQGGGSDIVEQLIAADADLNAKGSGDLTPLHWAAYVGDELSAKHLTSAGADVNARSTEGETPLYWAVLKSDILMVAMLTAADAEIDEKVTPFTKWSTRDVKRFLKKNGFRSGQPRDGSDETWFRVDTKGTEWVVELNRTKGNYPLPELSKIIKQSGLNVAAWET
jgi:ankyrin repeat protein/tetratricopeptide (TPR) repeat protein